MKIISSKVLGVMPVYDLFVDNDDHSFCHESGIILHNSAYLIANEPVSNFIPLTTVSNVKVTQYDMRAVEQSGGVKMDYLVINSLNDIRDCIKMVQEKNGCIFGGKSVQIDGKLVPRCRVVALNGIMHDIWDLPEDSAVFEDICRGRTETVFQFNTKSAKQWLG